MIPNLVGVCHDSQHRETMTDDCKHHSPGDKLKYTCDRQQKVLLFTTNVATFQSIRLKTWPTRAANGNKLTTFDFYEKNLSWIVNKTSKFTDEEPIIYNEELCTLHRNKDTIQ